MKIILSLVLCLSQLFFTQAVKADMIHVFPFWDESETESVAQEMVFTDGDILLTVTAWTASFNGDQEQLQDWQQVIGDDLGVYRDENGLGVISSDEDGNDLDGGSSGNYNNDPDEGLLLVFSAVVDLVDIFVGDLSSNDDFNFSVVQLIGPDAIKLNNTEEDISGPEFESEWAFEFDPTFSGSAFLVWVDGSSDDIELLGVAVVSAPASISIFIISMGLLLVRRRA